MRRFVRSQSGAAMVELAVVLPFLIFLLIGVIEVGRYMYFGIVAAHAAEAGAQYGAQSLGNASDSSGIEAAAAADAPNVSVTASPMPVCLESGQSVACPSGTPSPNMTEYIKVTVTGSFQSLLNYPGIPNPLPVTATAMMRVLGQ